MTINNGTDSMHRVRELSLAYLDDSLSDCEAEELKGLLERDEEARRLFVKELEFEVLLRMCFEEQRPRAKQSFSSRVMERLLADDNRRAGQRYEFGHPEVKMKYKIKEKDTSLGLARNVSESGVCFVGTDSMNVGECVEVVMSVDETGTPFRKKGKVVWVEEEDEKARPELKTWKIGCRFVPEKDGKLSSALDRQAQTPVCKSCTPPED